jgi:hypothetical protein
MKLMGTKTPIKKKNEAIVVNTNRRSFQGSAKTLSSNVRFLGGSRDSMVPKARMRSPRMRKAQIRIVQPKPTRGIRRDVMIGKMTPPSPEPAAWIPKAAPLFLRNHEVTELVAAANMALSPRGEQMPWARMNCQYSLQMLVIIRPKTWKKVPNMSSGLGP